LQQIVSKALAKTPSARYQSTEILLEDLRSLVRSHYAQSGVVPADKAASLRASRQAPKPGGLLGRLSTWASKTFSSAPPKDESSAGSSGTPDVTPSMWQSSNKKTIAILPFKNLSGAPENDFYGFSLADSVITELAQLHDLVV